MGSRERLWTIFGPAWGWPAATMTYEADQADLLRHEKEIAAHPVLSKSGPAHDWSCPAGRRSADW